MVLLIDSYNTVRLRKLYKWFHTPLAHAGMGFGYIVYIYPKSHRPAQPIEVLKQIWKEKTELNFIVLFNSINFYYKKRNVYLYQNKSFCMGAWLNSNGNFQQD